MSLLQAILLGIIQGLTEFLPVSSSGHLVIFQNIFHINADGGMLFDIMLHLGTLVAVITVYRRDIKKMLIETIKIGIDIVKNIKTWIYNRKFDEALRYKRIIHNNYRKFVVLILVSTIPTAIIGYTAKSLVEAAGKTLVVPGVCLLITGVLLLVSEISEEGHKIPKDVSYSSGFFIGIAQGLATLPGLSRSGATIAACLLGGFDRRFAVKYSFIMSIPAILGAAVLELKDVGKEAVSGSLVFNCVIGAAVAAVAGYICIKLMLKIVKNKKLKGFAFYCFAIGTVAIIAHFVI